MGVANSRRETSQFWMAEEEQQRPLDVEAAPPRKGGRKYAIAVTHLNAHRDDLKAEKARSLVRSGPDALFSQDGSPDSFYSCA